MTPLLLKPAEDDTDVVSAQNHILLIYCQLSLHESADVCVESLRDPSV